MTKKEELFYLIKAMSRSEKRYFRLFAGQMGSGQNYLRLFEAIDRQEVFDDQALREQFAGEPFMNQLHVTKNYLRNAILKSLRNFHAESSHSAIVKDVLRNIEILFNKELFRLCDVELKRAEKIARTYELTEALVEVLDWKRRLHQNKSPRDHRGFLAHVDAQKSAINLLQNHNNYLSLIGEISEGMFHNKPLSTANKSLLRTAKNALTLDAKVLHYSARSFHNVRLGRSNQAQKALYEAIQLMEKYPYRIAESPGIYVSTVNNYISFLLFTKKITEATDMVERAKNTYQNWKIKSENRSLLKQILRTYNLELEIIRLDPLSYPGERVESIATFVAAHLYKMPVEYTLMFWFQLGYIYFLKKDNKNAFHWITHLIQTRHRKVRTDIHIQARFLNLIMHLENESYFVLRYFVESTRRYIKRAQSVEPYQRVLLAFFSRISRAAPLDHKKLYQELHAKLFPVDKDPVIPASVLNYLDYRTWLAGKV